MAKGNDKTTWDVYTWVGSGPITIRESNVSLKDAKRAKEKWIAKSAKHEAFIATHSDKKIVKGLIKETDHKVKSNKTKSSKTKSAKTKSSKTKSSKQTKSSKSTKSKKK